LKLVACWRTIVITAQIVRERGAVQTDTELETESNYDNDN